MGTYSVEPSKLKATSRDLLEVCKNVRKAEEMIEVAGNIVLGDDDISKSIKEAIKKVRESLNKKGTEVTMLAKELDQISLLYSSTEREILKYHVPTLAQIKHKESSKKEIRNNKIHNWNDFKKWLYENLPKDKADKIIKGFGVVGTTGKFNFEKAAFELMYNGSSADGNSKEAGIFRITIPGKEGVYSTSAVIIVGAASAGASGSATLEKGIQGKASAEANGIKMNFHRRLGTKYDNFHDSMHINILNANATAKGHAGIDGVGAKAGGRAEIISATNRKGVTSGGVDIYIEGSAGVGAVAEVNGQIDTEGINLSAALGIGPQVGAGAGVDYSNIRNAWRSQKISRAAYNYTSGGGGYSKGGGGKDAFGGA